MIEIRNLSKTYKTREGLVDALDNINLTITGGEIYGLIGLSGAGKSSLLRCINLLEEPTSGEIIVKGVNIQRISRRELREERKKIGMIFQHFNLLMNSTVYDNIAFPLRLARTPDKKIRERVNELLKIVCLEDKRDSYPISLSGGQKQRVGIARALATSPDILLCDEATSALDPTTTESILDLLRDINRLMGITIVVVTHEMEVIKKLCHRVAVLEDGNVVEEGRVVDIFANPVSSTSKKFLKDDVANLPQELLHHLASSIGKVIRVSFLGEAASLPFISRMVKHFDVDANILTGNIETIQGLQVGSLILKLSGEASGVEEAIKFLIENNLRVELIENELN